MALSAVMAEQNLRAGREDLTEEESALRSQGLGRAAKRKGRAHAEPRGQEWLSSLRTRLSGLAGAL